MFLGQFIGFQMDYCWNTPVEVSYIRGFGTSSKYIFLLILKSILRIRYSFFSIL
ncbi:hypothetical protein LEP1GSC128_4129 [Leptospira borgpetersenii str. 200801926]|uniref:Uncharacterized protein n=3 Tax=Leptospira borgpetersenii TaxID=174 RepID=A0A0S2IMH0_LEPBO|nr:hypothetical protein LBBP_00492 [Leptospira borgpetersenii serovar Ballum]EKP12289.1 hypothetical protein LEP1GSC128_4129 [Leptospira borgpetersenii str. 200801926]EKR02137.1 hypothetical protein LEP1GSC121_0786 [Leptospira borgpetersenii serovar Castellonis str. 200801910]EMK10040.1 hypothetical protein LEP1GSC066_0895 [Leptospira sp. serovar Kenya str. Sh9]EMN12347.1 hypothetical protein LEP1GSC055_1234 [Leptospira borgpetersenii str. Brem 307]EMN17466.1 hypothetical protein LEP1GSC056_39